VHLVQSLSVKLNTSVIWIVILADVVVLVGRACLIYLL